MYTYPCKHLIAKFLDKNIGIILFLLPYCETTMTGGASLTTIFNITQHILWKAVLNLFLRIVNYFSCSKSYVYGVRISVGDIFSYIAKREVVQIIPLPQVK